MVGWKLLLSMVIAAIALLVPISILISRARRPKLMELLAARLGYTFSPEGGRRIPDRLCFMTLFAHRSSWEVSNLMFGRHGRMVVQVFDYHGEVTTWGRPALGAGVVAVEVAGARFEKFLLRRETLGDKVKAAAGLDDIDFESHEFSEKFFVQCTSKRFAYDVVTAKQMELLLSVDEITIEMGESGAVFYLRGRPPVERLERLHDIALRFMANIPDFVLEGAEEARSDPA